MTYHPTPIPKTALRGSQAPVFSEKPILGICTRCGYEFTQDDCDPHVTGLAYCPNDGHPMNYDS